jgi:hypothetical protein
MRIKIVAERMLDKTLADSFPASDPPSTLPNPTFDSFSSHEEVLQKRPESHRGSLSQDREHLERA